MQDGSVIWNGIRILPFFLMVKSEFPAAKLQQQLFADDGSNAGYFAYIRALFERLQQLGPNYG